MTSVTENSKDPGPRTNNTTERKSYCGGRKKNNKHKTHKHFSDGPCGTIVPGTNPHPSQGQTGQTGHFTVELNRKRPACLWDGSRFVPGTLPVCPRCFLFVPNTVPPKMFMFIVFSCPMVRKPHPPKKSTTMLFEIITF